MPQTSASQAERMRRAIAALPEPTGTVYCLHLLDGLDYPAIAARLGLELREIEAHIAEAILSIDRELRRQEREGRLRRRRRGLR